MKPSKAKYRHVYVGWDKHKVLLDWFYNKLSTVPSSHLLI